MSNENTARTEENAAGREASELSAALCAKQIKAEISDLLQRALSGRDETLRYEQNYIRWGLVEVYLRNGMDDGQRVKVLVRAIEPSAERESKHDSI